MDGRAESPSGETLMSASPLNMPKGQNSPFQYSKNRLAEQTQALIQHAKSEKEALTLGQAQFKAAGLSPPKGKHTQGTLLRMIDPDIWERKLRQRSKQKAEKIIRDQGRIFKKGEVYSSDYNVNNFIQMQKDNKAFLKRQHILSDHGDELSLATIAASSIANLSHRRTEMMTRMRGTEETAQQKGLICLFITFTAASIFHPKRFVKTTGAFIDNPRYRPVLNLKNAQGKIQKTPNTPKEAHAFIKRIVNRSIAKFKRENIDYMGYKVVEPHHDGTPHWHMAFFVHPEQTQQATDIFTHYALQEYGEEQGAKQHRLIIKIMIPNKAVSQAIWPNTSVKVFQVRMWVKIMKQGWMRKIPIFASWHGKACGAFGNLGSLVHPPSRCGASCADCVNP